MSTSSGYVHISVRNAQNRSRAVRQAGPSHYGYGNPGVAPGSPYAYSPQQRFAPVPVAATAPRLGPANSSSADVARPDADAIARGFVLYVGIDEDTAADAGTSLAKLAQEVRKFVQTLVPEAESHAAVAIAPSTAIGSDLEVVRRALGDPTAARAQRIDSAINQESAPRPNGVLIDLPRREVHLDGESLNLTYKEFELLSFLVDNGTRTVTRDELLDSLWSGSGEVPNERTIDVHIRRLRSKLGRLANTVRTVRGQGYRFYEHPEVVIWSAPEYSI
ncbi:winged helix-turn-helix domain-containing protein [Haematomicrobium sanguinis]|uniref:winged helix-turn-helix domain-containing protein n=1 Tax=Haematomicrobium sanguinis TaxID=479106 RepID=UPI00047B64FF|nr:winged helix-turn-helix domain-containing protein [Haematomicrobium sanguinis]